MRKNNKLILILTSVFLLASLTALFGQDSQVRPKKDLNAEFVLDARPDIAPVAQFQEEPGTIIEDLEELDPVGDWLIQFAWYQRIERFLPGLILLGLLLGKVAKYTPGKQDDLISGGMLLLGRLLQRKKPTK
jgi:hypothetical protein